MSAVPAEVPVVAAPVVEEVVWMDNEDLNGECFISGELGEVETQEENRFVWFPADSPRANAPGVPVVFTNAQAQAFVTLNAKALKAYNVRMNGRLSDAEICKIAYLRYLAARNGLVNPDWDSKVYNVKYNEAKHARDMTPGDDATVIVVAVNLPVAVRRMLRVNFSNLVGLVAYFFRVRGHHWLEDMDAGYEKLWKKCLKASTGVGIHWQNLAHDALHAIFPIVLDNYWAARVDEGNISGALMKRFDSAPAGVASIRALHSGIQDLRMAIPIVMDRFSEEVKYVDVLVAQAKANRWDGSINKRLYGAKGIAIDEARFSGIAATIFASLEAFAPDSALLGSPALKRIANGAPITGAVLARIIASLATDVELMKGGMVVRD